MSSPRRVAITGSTGLVGSALKDALRRDGIEVVPLVRRDPKPGEVRWDVRAKTIDAAGLEGVDAVVHLAGESVAGGRWTDARKARILDSRVDGTTLLAEALAGLEAKPKVLVSASAVGYYGDRGDARLAEDAPAGEGFLAEVCVAWEAAADAAREAGIRVAHPRIGIVLSAEGGALEKMKTPFKLGVGGVIGSGDQYMSWLHLDDLVAMLRFAIDTDALSGPFNATAPEPATNRAFTEALGKALSRPTFMPLPKFAAKLAMGSEMADEMLLSSTRAVPAKLRELGFQWRFPELGAALADVV
ncbi:MAG TPA: TIGR01777 family oxidoreductase [Polyangiaceae bacterium LLY-WYZ-15_(1-7)]|nr:TIGR01777 family protein [Myxococcales bacterium]MAT27853.1 TIGR01777 family protein [Sandaracinus sp.]HJL05862.1 TIGR01777 family oxidoreductase [Polyangiaceae bacterium LLY-WYZ-15_(1-7)]MBJ71289.1 TIGR01777 family protein [Sandaracinus sp.]HJL13859.1 TIGR01777 family oxidoreductase [Polyangiaceae bacterium LLY-WYZ-15_(1-7)]